jgi:hypothetical protein
MTDPPFDASASRTSRLESRRRQNRIPAALAAAVKRKTTMATMERDNYIAFLDFIEQHDACDGQLWKSDVFVNGVN